MFRLYVKRCASLADKLVIYIAMMSYLSYRLFGRLRWGKENRNKILNRRQISLEHFLVSDLTLRANGCKYRFKKKQKLSLGDSKAEVHKLLNLILQPGDIFFDIGCNFGQYTLPLAKLIGNDGRAIAIDANPDNIQNLKENIKLNKLANVTPLNIAVSDQDGYAPFYLTELSGTGSLLKNSGNNSSSAQAIQVQTVTLDSLVSSLALDREIKLLKIDIEGNELDCIKGARASLQKTRHLLIECHSTQNRKDVETLLRGDFLIKEVDYYQELDTSHIFCTNTIL